MLLAGGGEEAAGGARLGDAALGQVDVHPAGEAIREVPLGLAVADERQAGVRLVLLHGDAVGGGIFLRIRRPQGRRRYPHD